MFKQKKPEPRGILKLLRAICRCFCMSCRHPTLDSHVWGNKQEIYRQVRSKGACHDSRLH